MLASEPYTCVSGMATYTCLCCPLVFWLSQVILLSNVGNFI